MVQECPRRPPTVHDLGPQGGRPHVTLANAGADNVNARFVLARLAAWLGSLEAGASSVAGTIRPDGANPMFSRRRGDAEKSY
jgi:hypothetical protein